MKMKAMTRTMIGLLGIALLAGLAGCQDERVGNAAPAVDRFYVGDLGEAPGLDQFGQTPDDGSLTMDFGLVDVGTVARKYLFLRNTGRGDLVLASLEVDSGTSSDFQMNCSTGGVPGACPAVGGAGLTVVPGQDLIIEVGYGPNDVGPDQGAFSLVLNASDHKRIDVSLSGQGVTPEIQVCATDCVGAQDAAGCSGAAEVCNDAVAPDDLAVDFGDTQLGPGLTRTVWVRNLGDRPLSVSGVALSGGDASQFAVDGAGFELPAGQERALEVTYAPSLGGPHATVMEISSNDVNEGELRVQLTGRGLAPRLCPDPLSLDFGNVGTGERAELAFTITNCGLLELNLTDLRLSDASSPDFSLIDPPALPAVLQPEETVEVTVEYHPAEMGSDSGGVELYSDDPASDQATGLTGTISLMGDSIPRQCDIQATPFAANFGGVVQGELGEIQLIVSNQGTDDCTLESTEITTNSAADEFSILEAPPNSTAILPGDSVIVRLQYAPTDLGADSGVLSLFANDKDGDEVTVALNGEGIDQAVCDLDVVPTNLYFGAVTVYRTKAMVVQLVNKGMAPCTITGVDLAGLIPFQEYDFTITAMPNLPLVLGPRGQANAQAEIEITMAPPDPSMLQMGDLTITVDDDDLGELACTDADGIPIPNQACVMVSGFAMYSDVEVVPADIDFGVVTLGCNSPERCVTIYNLGSQSHSVTDIYLEDGADPNFEIRSAPMLPHTLIGGGDFQVCLRYTPQDLLVHRNALYVVLDGDEVIVPVFGRGTDTAEQTDVFHQLDQVKADVLFVIDCSGSMSDNQENLIANFTSFIAQATAMDVDLHLGVVATDVDMMNSWTGTPPRQVTSGVLVNAPSRPKILTNTTPDLEAAFGDNARLGDDCSNTEAGLEGAWMALSEPLVSDPAANAGFLREDAKLYIIVVSDEPDQSNGSVDFYVDFFSSLKGYRNTEMMSISAICTSCDSDRYWDVTVRTGGICETIDTADWAGTLAAMGIDAFNALREFPLSRPADPATIVVTVDLVEVDQATTQGGADGWSHYVDTNTIYFGDDVVPDRGQRIEVSYTAVCF